jgi:pimeloyl-ACP methyl ester carboxylesterase
VFVCVVFHREGWLPGAIELDEEADAFLGDWYGEVSPDGREHWPVVKAEPYVAHLTEPALTPRDLARVTCPTLVMQGDRDEMPVEHTRPRCSARSQTPPGGRPRRPHGLLVERPELSIIGAFLR